MISNFSDQLGKTILQTIFTNYQLLTNNSDFRERSAGNHGDAAWSWWGEELAKGAALVNFLGLDVMKEEEDKKQNRGDSKPSR